MTISRKDQADLMWFLGEGQTVCERSPTGQQLDVAETYAVAGKRDDGLRAGVCKSCNGDGHTEGIACVSCSGTGANGAAYRTGSDMEYREAPHDPALLRYAAISRRLLAMRPRGLCTVLCAYWGHQGDRWGRELRGRVWSIISLPVEGQSRTPEEWSSLVVKQAKSPNLERGREITRAVDAANRLLREAEEEWKRHEK